MKNVNHFTSVDKKFSSKRSEVQGGKGLKKSSFYRKIQSGNLGGAPQEVEHVLTRAPSSFNSLSCEHLGPDQLHWESFVPHEFAAVLSKFDEQQQTLERLQAQSSPIEFGSQQTSLSQIHQHRFEDAALQALPLSCQQQINQKECTLSQGLIQDSSQRLLQRSVLGAEETTISNVVGNFSLTPEKCERVMQGVLNEVFSGLHGVVRGGGSMAEYVAPMALTRPILVITHGCLDLSHEVLRYASKAGIYGGHFFITQALPWMSQQVQGLAQRGGLQEKFIRTFQERSERALTASPLLQKFAQKGEIYARHATNVKNFAMNLLGDLTGKTAEILASLKTKESASEGPMTSPQREK